MRDFSDCWQGALDSDNENDVGSWFSSVDAKRHFSFLKQWLARGKLMTFKFLNLRSLCLSVRPARANLVRGRHFKSTEIVSSDFCAVWFATTKARSKRLMMRLNSFISSRANDSKPENLPSSTRRTCKKKRERRCEVARDLYVQPVALVLDVPETVCLSATRRGPTDNSGRTS
jgi:hypothetical protein